MLLILQGKLSEAEPLFKRTQEILEKKLGQDHPNVAVMLNNRASLLKAQVRAVSKSQEYCRGSHVYYVLIIVWPRA